MIGPLTFTRIFLAVGITDMRKSIDGLSLLVEQAIGLSPFDGNLFVFCNRQQQIDHLQEMLRLHRNELFGRKSEARVDHIDPNQLQLYAPNETPAPITPEEKVPVKGHARKKRGRKPLPEELPRVEVVHDIPEAEKQCACGATLSRIGADVSEKLDFVPAKPQVIRNIQPKYTCKCCEGVEDQGSTVKIVPVPLQLIAKSIASEGLLDHILALVE
jgi:transposase